MFSFKETRFFSPYRLFFWKNKDINEIFRIGMTSYRRLKYYSIFCCNLLMFWLIYLVILLKLRLQITKFFQIVRFNLIIFLVDKIKITVLDNRTVKRLVYLRKKKSWLFKRRLWSALIKNISWHISGENILKLFNFSFHF